MDQFRGLVIFQLELKSSKGLNNFAMDMSETAKDLETRNG